MVPSIRWGPVLYNFLKKVGFYLTARHHRPSLSSSLDTWVPFEVRGTGFFVLFCFEFGPDNLSLESLSYAQVLSVRQGSLWPEWQPTVSTELRQT